MIKVNAEELEKDLNGVVVFIVTDCVVCRNYLKELSNDNIDTSDWKLFDCDENLAYSMDTLKLDDMPTTRVYKDGEVIWQMSGILYDLQINMLRGSLIATKEST